VEDARLNVRGSVDVYVLPLTASERDLVRRAIRLFLDAEVATDWQDQQARSVLAMLERPLDKEELRSLVYVLV
jgi:hypothetical protein